MLFKILQLKFFDAFKFFTTLSLTSGMPSRKSLENRYNISLNLYSETFINDFFAPSAKMHVLSLFVGHTDRHLRYIEWYYGHVDVLRVEKPQLQNRTHCRYVHFVCILTRLTMYACVMFKYLNDFMMLYIIINSIPPLSY